MRVRRSHHVVAIDARVHDLADAVAVGEAHDKTVLGRVVLVLVLDHQTTALVVVGLALTATAVLGLVALEVRLVLHDLLERHFLFNQKSKHHTKNKQTKKVQKRNKKKEKKERKENNKSVFLK